MKRAAMIVVTLALAISVHAQYQAPAPQQQPPAAQAGTAQPGATPPGAPQGKRPPQAKTQPEFDAYNAAMASRNDPSAMEKAADDFAIKFPSSELSPLLYRSVMHSYQSANNADKMLEMGRKVLKIDPDDPEALVGVSEVLAERTRDTDLDKDQRLDEAMKLAQRAVETVDTDVVVPAGTPRKRSMPTRALCDPARIRSWERCSSIEKNMSKRKALSASPSMLFRLNLIPS